MLDHRDYMRNNRHSRNIGCIFAPGAVVTLIITSLIIFLLSTSGVLLDLLSLKVIAFHENPIVATYRLLSYIFLHGGITHILFNMWGLYLFGSLLEQRIGSQQFYMLYFISGISGGLFWLLANWSEPLIYTQTLEGIRAMPKFCIGASGAVFGVMIATALFYPDMRIMLLIPPIPMKLKTFAFAYATVEILLELSGTDPRIAHLAHLGGFFGGYLYIKLLYGNAVWGIESIFKKKVKHSLYNKGEFIFSNPKRVSQEELDRLLDKISNEGINSLSEEEMDTLRQAREEMNSR